MIGSAIQKGDWIYVYDEKGSQLCSMTGQLQGYTGTSFSVKKNGWIYVYDERGSQLSSHSC
ncbi:MAG: hypothetical protein IJ911_08520 [Salinivirgaceae bacterium]|nr:hypothetical protein [Salinivirgaceae bacterium]MBR7065011.1 hypothetical protein [Treponema sp.]